MDPFPDWMVWVAAITAILVFVLAGVIIYERWK